MWARGKFYTPTEELNNLLSKFERGIIGQKILLAHFRNGFQRQHHWRPHRPYPSMLAQEFNELGEQLPPIKRLAFAICQMEGGLGITQNPQSAYAIYQDFARSLPIAQCLLGYVYKEGTQAVCEKSEARAFETLEGVCYHPLGQYYLGLLYKNKNEQKYLSHLHNAAEQHCIPALDTLAHHYKAHGNFQLATHFFQIAAKLDDDASTQHTAGFDLLFDAEGKVDEKRTPQEQQAGADLLKKAADNNYRPSHRSLAYLYQYKDHQTKLANNVKSNLLVLVPHDDIAEWFAQAPQQQRIAFFKKLYFYDDHKHNIDAALRYVNRDTIAKWLPQATRKELIKIFKKLYDYKNAHNPDIALQYAEKIAMLDDLEFQSLLGSKFVNMQGKVARGIAWFNRGYKNPHRSRHAHTGMHEEEPDPEQLICIASEENADIQALVEALIKKRQGQSKLIFSCHDDHLDNNHILFHLLALLRKKYGNSITHLEINHNTSRRIRVFSDIPLGDQYSFVGLDVLHLKEIISVLLTSSSLLVELTLSVHHKVAIDMLPTLLHGVREAKQLTRLNLSSNCIAALQGKREYQEIVTIIQKRTLGKIRQGVELLSVAPPYSLRHKIGLLPSASRENKEQQYESNEQKDAKWQHAEKMAESGDAISQIEIGYEFSRTQGKVARGLVLLNKAAKQGALLAEDHLNEFALHPELLRNLAAEEDADMRMLAETIIQKRLNGCKLTLFHHDDYLFNNYVLFYLLTVFREKYEHVVTHLTLDHDPIVIPTPSWGRKMSSIGLDVLHVKEIINTLLTPSSQLVELTLSSHHYMAFLPVLPELLRGVQEARQLTYLHLPPGCIFALQNTQEGQEITTILQSRLSETKLADELPPLESPAPLSNEDTEQKHEHKEQKQAVAPIHSEPDENNSLSNESTPDAKSPISSSSQGLAEIAEQHEEQDEKKDAKKNEHEPTPSSKHRNHTKDKRDIDQFNLFHKPPKKPKTEVQPVPPDDIKTLQMKLRQNIALIRADDNCQSNCNSLANHLFDVIAALLSGRPPSTEPVTTERQDNDTYVVTTKRTQLKQPETGEYKGAPITQVIASWMISSANQNLWVNHASFTENSAGELELKRDILAEPNQEYIENLGCSYDALDERLKKMAEIKKQALYGSITLNLAGASARRCKNDHVIVFYATATDVFYIDAQNYNGVDRCGEPIFTTIKSLDFAKPGQANEGRYGPNCFYFIEGFVDHLSHEVSAQSTPRVC
jgi:hypothetical protein